MEVNSFDFAKNRKFPSLLATVITQIYNFCINESIVRYKFTRTNDRFSIIVNLDASGPSASGSRSSNDRSPHSRRECVAGRENLLSRVDYDCMTVKLVVASAGA